MIHVGVGQQNDVDGRQVVDADAGLTLSPEDHKTGREDGVDQDVAAAVQTAELQQERGMPLKHHAEFARLHGNGLARDAADGILVALPGHPGDLSQLGENEGPTHPQSAHTMLMRGSCLRIICRSRLIPATRIRIYRHSRTT